jgi:hypothetical protein
VERHATEAIVRPFAVENRSTDACPRARLAFSLLVGLAMSRYVLIQEPLASADPETLAAWIGPSLDRYLDGGLGGATAVGRRREHPDRGGTANVRPLKPRDVPWAGTAALTVPL